MSKNQLSTRQALAVGGGMMLGLGIGFFALPYYGGTAFVGGLIGGLGVGLLLAVMIKSE